MSTKIFTDKDGKFYQKGAVTDANGITYTRSKNATLSGHLKTKTKTQLEAMGLEVLAYVQPEQIPAATTKTAFTQKEWMARFDVAEKDDYKALLASGDADIVSLNLELMISPTVNIESPEAQGGLQLLRFKEVIKTDERLAELQAPDVISTESV